MALPESVVSQFLSAQNNLFAKVAYFSMAHSDSIKNLGHFQKKEFEDLCFEIQFVVFFLIGEKMFFNCLWI